MGVGQALARLGVAGAHVLVVEAPGHWLTRCALHDRMLDRGWREALSAADADVLAVCGAPGPELSGLIDRIWDQLPGPRARIDVESPSPVDGALDRAAAELLDGDRQRADARSRPHRPDIATQDQHEGMDHEGMDHGDMDHGDMDHGDMDHGDMDHGDMDHGDMDHGDMDHGDMDMAPEGIPLAQGAEDRDLLEMDTLHLRLGPVLPYWPAGVVMRCSLNGDVITEAQAWLVDAATDPDDGSEPTALGGALQAARECDHVRNVLALAGWSRGAAIARRCRDLLLAHDEESAVRLLHNLQRGARRSVLLRWSLRDIGSLSGDELRRRGLPAALDGDAYSRLLSRLDIATDLLSDPLRNNPFRLHLPAALDALPRTVTGLDVAAARLTVAGLGIETCRQTEADVP